MQTFKQYLHERHIPDIDVTFVRDAVEKIDFDNLWNTWDVIDALNSELEPQITFELGRANGGFGRGVFKDRVSARTGILSAKYNGPDDDYLITVTLTNAALKGFKDHREMAISRLQEFIKHELIHKYQDERSGGKLGTSPDGDDYYFDPHEIHAIVSEMVTQLLRIEPDRDKLINMIQHRDKKLEKSDRWRLYVHLVAEKPEYQKQFNKVVKELIAALQG